MFFTHVRSQVRLSKRLTTSTPVGKQGASTKICCARRLLSAGQKVQKVATSSSRGGGNIFISLGWALLGLVVVDQALQYKHEWEAQEHRNMLQSMQLEADAENRVEWDASLPTLFQCKITHTEPSLDGTKMLRNIRVGDTVEVIEAETGPNQAYHLCRVVMKNNNTTAPARTTPTKTGSVGWYPIDYLQKI